MKAIRCGICGLVAFAVLAFGGVQPWGRVVLEIGAALLLVFWGVLAIRRGQAEIPANWLYLPLLGIAAIALLQYLFGLTIYPYLTKTELILLGAYIVLCFLANQSFRTEDQKIRFLWFLLSLGFAVSLFGIIQHFTFNGNLYWSVPLPPAAVPFGPFVDGDHFAGFVELIVPLGLAFLLFRSRRREQVVVLLLFTVVSIGALLLSASRAGIISLVVELGLLAALSRTQRTTRKQFLRTTAIVLLAGTFLIWLGVNKAIERFERLAREGVSGELRVSIYQDTWRIFRDYRWTGTGLGTLVTIYPRYASFYNGRTVDHAHNDFLELLSETGLIGGLCGLSFVTLLFWRGLGKLQRAEGSMRAIGAGSLVACAGMLLHGLLDFNLHIPANALIFFLLGFTATTSFSVESQGKSRPSWPRLVKRLGDRTNLRVKN